MTAITARDLTFLQELKFLLKLEYRFATVFGHQGKSI